MSNFLGFPRLILTLIWNISQKSFKEFDSIILADSCKMNYAVTWVK